MEPDRPNQPDAAAGVNAPGPLVAARPMLYGLAYRMLGSTQDAEDVLQEAYLRWSTVDTGAVAEPRRYLTRVVARLALDALRERTRRRESYVGTWLPEPVATDPSPFGAVDTSDLSLAVLHLMERLTPPQRAVYVLRTAFEFGYAEIAGIVERTPEDCRQLYRRAADALHAGRSRFTPDPDAHARLLADFVAAARNGDLTRLERLLHRDVVVWSDGGGRVPAARSPIATPAKAARFFAGIYSRRGPLTTTPVFLNCAPALVMRTPRTRHVLAVEVSGGQIVDVYLVGNPAKLSALRTR
jgi:RNA polymerase sigma-70 factor (ECF subfamily)